MKKEHHICGMINLVEVFRLHAAVTVASLLRLRGGKSHTPDILSRIADTATIYIIYEATGSLEAAATILGLPVSRVKAVVDNSDELVETVRTVYREITKTGSVDYAPATQEALHMIKALDELMHCREMLHIIHEKVRLIERDCGRRDPPPAGK